MIPFTYFKRPNGEKHSISIYRAPFIEAMANTILAKGYRFECEMLMNGVISLTVSNDDEDIAIELVPQNDARVPVAVDTLIKRVYLLIQEKEG